MKKSNKLGIIASILLLMVYIMIFISLIDIYDRRKYDEACSNPPGEMWIEEDLEAVFLTTQLTVLEIDDSGDGSLVVTVCIYDEYYDEYEEKAYHVYRCLYEVKKHVGYYSWEFIRYV